MIATLQQKSKGERRAICTNSPRSMRSLSTGTVGEQNSALFPVGPESLHSSTTSSVGGLRMAQEFIHHPVLVLEVVDTFATVPSGAIVDVTLGGAGHAQAILNAHDQLGIFGVDRDLLALDVAKSRLERFGARARCVHGRFSELTRLISDAHEQKDRWPSIDGAGAPLPVTGLLADLGVSSPQLDIAERGFSFSLDGPLDMRMDSTQGVSATDYLATVSLDDLTSVLRENGEGKFARRIAKALKEAAPIATTTELVAVVDRAVPKANRRRGHVASRVFQALRIAVNGEDQELAELLRSAIDLVTPGGRIAIISYHSGEDGVVKHQFRTWANGGCTCPEHLPCVCGATPKGHVVTKRALRASEQELDQNPRSRSARLRVFEVAQ